MDISADFIQPSTDESGVSTQASWEAQGLQLLSAIELSNGRPINTVCYPGCGSDSTPQKAIPAAITIYIDPDPRSLKDLKLRHKDLRYCQTLEDFVIDHPSAQFDLVYLLNSYAPNDEAVKITRQGGKIVVNNWLNHANDFYSPKWSSRGIFLVGVLVQKEGSVRYVIESPRDSLDSVTTEKELIDFVAQIDPSLLEFYEQTQSIAVPNVIRNIFQQLGFSVTEGEDLVMAYKRFYDDRVDAQRIWMREQNIPEDIDVPLTIKGPSGHNIELPRLPPKMANVVLWVFEKRIL